MTAFFNHSDFLHIQPGSMNIGLPSLMEHENDTQMLPYNLFRFLKLIHKQNLSSLGNRRSMMYSFFQHKILGRTGTSYLPIIGPQII